MGAELQAAILQKRGQLKPVEQPAAGAAPAGHVAAGGSQGQGQVGAGAGGLEAVLRRGLQKFQLDGGDDTGNTDFLQSAMAARQGS